MEIVITIELDKIRAKEKLSSARFPFHTPRDPTLGAFPWFRLDPNVSIPRLSLPAHAPFHTQSVFAHTTRQISSFFDILHSHPDVASLVLHVCATPLREIFVSGTLSFGLARMSVSLHAAIPGCGHSKTTQVQTRAVSRRRLDIPLVSPQVAAHPNTPSGLEFTRRLTRLRVMREAMVPRMLKLPNVTQSSHVDRPLLDPSTVEYPWALDHPEFFPSLQTIVLTGPVRDPPERIGSGLLICTCPASRSRYKRGVMMRGRSLWDEAALIQGQGYVYLYDYCAVVRGSHWRCCVMHPNKP